MIDDQKKIWIAVVGGIIVLLIVLFSLRGDKIEENTTGIDNAMIEQGQEMENNDSVEIKTATPPANSPTPKPPVGLSYEEATELYEGRRTQFDSQCNASPSKLTYKNGTEIMFDNRSELPQTISFDDQTKNLLGFSFIVIKMDSPTAPYEVIIHCGQKKNVAQILLQP
jgi:hypothetical protein